MAPAALDRRAITVRVALLVVALLATALVSLRLGQDANWDLQNYHFYNAYAFLNDRLDWDIAPAQLQSYFNPLADLPFYAMVRAGLSPRWIAVVLALPAGIAAFFLYLSLERLFAGCPSPRSYVYIALALLIGVTGTAGVSLIGTTTNDWPPATLIVIAIWLLLLAADSTAGATKWWPLALAGLACGIAGGLKLTAAFYSASLCVALLMTVRPFRRRALACAATFAAFAAAGFVATAGFWLWRMYAKFGNPFFPYFNDWFQSPWWGPLPVQHWYGPQTLPEWLAFPFRLLRYNGGVVGEAAFRDWRIPAVFVAAIAALFAFAWRAFGAGGKVDRPTLAWSWRFVIAFWFLSFILWAFEHSIYRYVIPLELFAGAVAILLLSTALPTRAQLAGAVALSGVALIGTAYPASWRVPFAERFFDVEPPRLPNHALVLLVEDAPIAYVIPFLDPSARFVGAKNNLTDPERSHLLARAIRTVIAGHSGNFFSLQSSKGLGDDALTAYGLEKVPGQCTTIATNMTMGPLSLCELVRSERR